MWWAYLGNWVTKLVSMGRAKFIKQVGHAQISLLVLASCLRFSSLLYIGEQKGTIRKYKHKTVPVAVKNSGWSGLKFLYPTSPVSGIHGDTVHRMASPQHWENVCFNMWQLGIFFTTPPCCVFFISLFLCVWVLCLLRVCAPYACSACGNQKRASDLLRLGFPMSCS